MAGWFWEPVDDDGFVGAVDDAELPELVWALAAPRKLAPMAPPVMLAATIAPAKATLRRGVTRAVLCFWWRPNRSDVNRASALRLGG